MRKSPGFTLIELMVVMAIIAILATAGLSAYTGYIKKARDATRIADIKAINTIVLGSLSITGKPPQTAQAVHDLVSQANNGKGLYDPLANQNNGSGVKQICLKGTGAGFTDCFYTYRLCDGGMGYAVGTNFESASNKGLLTSDDIGSISDDSHDDWLYEVGACQISCAAVENGNAAGCPNINLTSDYNVDQNSCPTRIRPSTDDVGSFTFRCS